MQIDLGPICFNDPTLLPCPYCGDLTNYITQIVKYQCNKCGGKITFHHVPCKNDSTQTSHIELIKTL